MKEQEADKFKFGKEGPQNRLTTWRLVIPVILFLLALPVNEQRAIAQDQISARVVNSWFKFYGPRDFRRSQYPFFSSSNGCGPDIMRETVIGSALNRMLDEVTLNVDGRSIKINFANLCNAHDRCYMTIGKTKAECDRKFNEAMSEQCSKIEVGFQSKCADVGETYMRSIRSGLGDKSFKIAQEQQKRYESIISDSTPELRAYALRTSQVSVAKSEGNLSEVGAPLTDKSEVHGTVGGTTPSSSFSLYERKPSTGHGAI
ncbi:MAG: hypothetical protein IPL83_07115 [Bdellovibrionales bacterium]|nr:hypothetical protein [Bdellovibrionales bacterium]